MGGTGFPKLTLKLRHGPVVAFGWYAIHWSRQDKAISASGRAVSSSVVTNRLWESVNVGETSKLDVARETGAGTTVLAEPAGVVQVGVVLFAGYGAEVAEGADTLEEAAEQT